MQTLIKRLADNELGHAGGHQRGGVLVPRDCISFFPPLGPSPNPEARITVRFAALTYPVELRIIYYEQGTRNEFRLTPVPPEVLRNAKAGDFFILRNNGDGTYTGGVVHFGEPLHATILSDNGHVAGRITPKDYL